MRSSALPGAFLLILLGACGGGGGGSAAVVTDMHLAPIDPAVPLGTPVQFQAEAEYSNGRIRDVTGDCLWSSSDVAVATIDATGLARTWSQGTATITLDYDGHVAQSVLRVDPPILAALAIEPPAPTVVRGATLALTATGTFTDGSTLDMTATVTWSSSNVAVATVDAGGVVHGVAVGTCTIRALSGSVTDSVTLGVLPPPLVAIAVAPLLPSIPRGLTQQFTATGTYGDASTQDVTALAAWTSSDPNVATVLPTGLASALTAGTTTIEARIGTVAGNTVLTVEPEVLVSIAVAPDPAKLARGASGAWTATGTFSNASTRDLTATALWTSSDATVASATGPGLFLAGEPGTAVLTAEVGAVSGSATLDVYLPLARTGQTTCYDATGAVVPCAGTGQDGELQRGVAWTAARFTIGTGAEAGSVIDELTGLSWIRAPDGTTATVWLDALDAADALVASGHDDWRLPTRRELRSLMHDGWSNTSTWLAAAGFQVLATDYWTSSTLAILPQNAWNTDMYFGVVDVYAKAGGPRLWAVRTADEDATCRAARTGQITCYDAAGNAIACAGSHQDGELRSGVSWPSPRFAGGSGPDIVIDRLTGLEWQRAPDPTMRPWIEALAYAGALMLDGRDDWRLPNVLELESLYDAEPPDSASRLDAQGFTGLTSTYYWTSTSLTVDPTQAWQVQLGLGYVFFAPKVEARRVLAVRGP